MSARSAYLIGLRLDPTSENAEWHSMWFEGEANDDFVASSGGRVRWFGSENDARCKAVALIPIECELQPDPAAICDIAMVMSDVDSGQSGHESKVLDSLNLLDDLLITIQKIDGLPNRRSLDVFASQLTIGESMDTAIENAGGKSLVIETLYSALGRLFVRSSFEC